MTGPPINPPSVRYPFTLPEDLDPEVRRAIEFTFNGLVVHEQAFAALKPQVDSTAATANQAASTVAGGVTSFNSETGAVVFFPFLGTVDDQLGQAVYLTQDSDNGAKIIVGDSTPVTVQLNNLVTTPYFTIIDNDSTSIASLVPQGGALIVGDSTIQPFCFGVVFFDGTTFWCGGTPVATDSSLGIVQPDGVTIDIDSGGVIFTQVFADSGPPSFIPNTVGNPFYFDSSMSPWNGYVWFGNSWNRFN